LTSGGFRAILYRSIVIAVPIDNLQMKRIMRAKIGPIGMSFIHSINAATGANLCFTFSKEFIWIRFKNWQK
jgi:hypothetical protein